MKAFYVLILVGTLFLSEISEARRGCRARASGGWYASSGGSYDVPTVSRLPADGATRIKDGWYWVFRHTGPNNGVWQGTHRVGGGSYYDDGPYYSPRSHGYTESSYRERTTVDIHIHSEIERSSRSFSSW